MIVAAVLAIAVAMPWVSRGDARRECRQQQVGKRK